MLSVAVALIGGGGCRRHILEDFIKQLIDKERWKVLQKYTFWSMGRFNETLHCCAFPKLLLIAQCTKVQRFFSCGSVPYITKCFFFERSWQGQHYQFVWCYIFLNIWFWKSIVFYLRNLNRLLVFCVFNYKICWTSLVSFYVFVLF